MQRWFFFFAAMMLCISSYAEETTCPEQVYLIKKQGIHWELQSPTTNATLPITGRTRFFNCGRVPGYIQDSMEGASCEVECGTTPKGEHYAKHVYILCE